MLTAGLLAVCWFTSAASARVADDTLYREDIRRAAVRHGVDPELVRALIWHESRFRANAVGRLGEVGLMQLLPQGAAAEYARVHKVSPMSRRELFKVPNNLEVGCWYLGVAMRRWRAHDQQIERALVHYNAGERRAKTWCRNPSRGESDPISASLRGYVGKIMSRYHGYRRK